MKKHNMNSDKKKIEYENKENDNSNENDRECEENEVMPYILTRQQSLGKSQKKSFALNDNNTPNLQKQKSIRWSELGNVFKCDNGGICFEDGLGIKDESIVYFCGIIDILQVYNKRKKSEIFVKGTGMTSKQRPSISCVPPEQYANRFISFISPKIN